MGVASKPAFRRFSRLHAGSPVANVNIVGLSTTVMKPASLGSATGRCIMSEVNGPRGRDVRRVANVMAVRADVLNVFLLFKSMTDKK